MWNFLFRLSLIVFGKKKKKYGCTGKEQWHGTIPTPRTATHSTPHFNPGDTAYSEYVLFYLFTNIISAY